MTVFSLCAGLLLAACHMRSAQSNLPEADAVSKLIPKIDATKDVVISQAQFLYVLGAICIVATIALAAVAAFGINGYVRRLAMACAVSAALTWFASGVLYQFGRLTYAVAGVIAVATLVGVFLLTGRWIITWLRARLGVSHHGQ